MSPLKTVVCVASASGFAFIASIANASDIHAAKQSNWICEQSHVNPDVFICRQSQSFQSNETKPKKAQDNLMINVDSARRSRTGGSPKNHRQKEKWKTKGMVYNS